MSFVKPLNLLYFDLKSTASVEFRGAVLTLQSDGKVDLAVDGEKPIGISYMTSKNYKYPDVGSEYETGVEIGVVREGKAWVPYTITNGISIAIGDLIGTKGITVAGKAFKFDPTDYPGAWNATTLATIGNEQGMILGIALEAVADPGGPGASGEILTLLSIKDVLYQ